MKKLIAIASIIFLLSSCKQTRYTEIGMGGAGKLAVKSSELKLPKKQADHQVAITGETNEVSTASNLAATTKQSNQLNAKGLNHQLRKSYKSSFRRLTTSLKQGLKLIPKVKSINRQEVKQTLKNQKQIFGYEGANNAMKYGFTAFIIGLLAILFGLCLIIPNFQYWFSPNPALIFGFLLFFIGFIAFIIGGSFWLTGWLYDLYDNVGMILGIIISLILISSIFIFIF